MQECTNARRGAASAAFVHSCIRAFGFWCIAGLSVAVLAQTADRARTEALASRAAERMKALQREADQLAAQERTLLGDLRKLEIDRADQIQGVPAGRHPAEAGTGGGLVRGRRGSPSWSGRILPNAPTFARASSRYTNSGRPAICACCSRRPTCGASAKHRARWRRSRSSIASACCRTSEHSTR